MTDSEKLDLLLTEMQEVKSGVQDLRTEMQEVKSGVQGLKTEMQELNRRVTDLEIAVRDINLTLENEIRENIQRVAEGHLDLSHNLHNALEIDNEKEMLSIRVSVLETELRRIKRQLETA